ncbi:MAG: glycerophosphodiester phosphodiesterase [Gemmatimonadetes bacterium]|nr:glycerophosphodiester phosphodiesterase [Gemmatimonadota bacterium]
MIVPPRPGHRYLAGAPLLFAHRGGAKLAPENTLEAFRAAVERWQADVLELDVRRTRDGELVVLHDPTVDRTTDGTGAVVDLDWREVRELDAAHRFVDLAGEPSFRGTGVRIPRFLDLLQDLPHARLNVDAKDPAAQVELVELLHGLGQAHRVLLASENEEGRADRLGYRGATSATRGQLRLFASLHRLPGGGPYTPRTDALQIPYRWKERQIVTPRLVREAHRRNLPVHVWLVDEPEVMRLLLSWGADGIQTDRPDILARVLHEETGRPLPPGFESEMGGGVGQGEGDGDGNE